MSENATPFGPVRVYLSSWCTCCPGGSPGWRFSGPHVLTMDIEHIGSAIATLPKTASDATMIAVAGVFLLFISCASFAAAPFGPRTRPAADRAVFSRHEHVAPDRRVRPSDP